VNRVGVTAAEAGGGAMANVLRGPASTVDSGQPLEPATQARMEERFGYAFGDVRVHTDDRAAASAQALGALAYTAGPHVTFARDRYAPGTVAGDRLLSHELAHVVQQDAAGPLGSSSTLDGEADAAADAAMTGRPPTIAHRAPAGQVQRQEAPAGAGTQDISVTQKEDDWALKQPPTGLPKGVSIVRRKDIPCGDRPVDAELLRDAHGATLTIIVRTWFIFMPDEGPWSMSEQQSWQDQFVEKVNKKWSAKHYLEPEKPCPGQPPRVDVRVRCVPVRAGSPHHVAVTVWRGKPGGRDRSHMSNADDTMRVRESDIRPGWPSQQVTVEHEFGHAMGINHIACNSNDDECYGRGDEAADVMGKGPTVSAKDYQVFADLMTADFANGCTYKVKEASAPPRNIMPLVMGAVFGTLGAVLGGVLGSLAGPLGAFIGAGAGLLLGGLGGYLLGRLDTAPG